MGAAVAPVGDTETSDNHPVRRNSPYWNDCGVPHGVIVTDGDWASRSSHATSMLRNTVRAPAPRRCHIDRYPAAATRGSAEHAGR